MHYELLYCWTYFNAGENVASNEISTSIFISKSNFGGGLIDTAVDCVVDSVDFKVVDLVVGLVVDCVVDSVVVDDDVEVEMGFITMSPSFSVVKSSVKDSIGGSDEDFVVSLSVVGSAIDFSVEDEVLGSGGFSVGVVFELSLLFSIDMASVMEYSVADAFVDMTTIVITTQPTTQKKRNTRYED